MWPELIAMRPSPSSRLIISLTAGRLTMSRSAIRAWMTSTSSSFSSKMHSQYSSKAGWCSPEAGMPKPYRAAKLECRPDLGSVIGSASAGASQPALGVAEPPFELVGRRCADLGDAGEAIHLGVHLAV